jgi:hypothetical protein
VARLSVEVTIPISVHVDTDTGEIEYTIIHGDSFQSGPEPPQVYTGSDPFLSEEDVDEYLDPQDPLYKEAVALYYRMRLAVPEFLLPFVAQDTDHKDSGEPTYGSILPDLPVSWTSRQEHVRFEALFAADQGKDAALRDARLEAQVSVPIEPGVRERVSPLGA